MGYIHDVQTVVELPTYIRNAERLFTREEREAVIDTLASNPYAGDEIPGTGGVRKIRFGAKGKGKRGGSRVIYFVFDEANPIYLLGCYAKNEATDLTPGEKKAVSAFATAIKAAARERTRR